ncbi:hypothetical protein BXP70_24820 [Hymenobacter crusticola]|uniref:Uncharacterized protein n=1 Tax=Hymenobacter crusticola TaxID=1770526 RepID=A0A243W6X5_9BACT|nr:hypothetical protein BXP70_24820 [Hymenobacter crusticola]
MVIERQNYSLICKPSLRHKQGPCTDKYRCAKKGLENRLIKGRFQPDFAVSKTAQKPNPFCEVRLTCIVDWNRPFYGRFGAILFDDLPSQSLTSDYAAESLLLLVAAVNE